MTRIVNERSVAAADPAPTEPDRLAALQWLVGCWSLDDGRRRVEEEWSRNGDGPMVGHGREFSAPELAPAEEEYLAIELRNGSLNYLARLNDRKSPDSFPAIEASDKRVVFENKAHDFPQRIGYERVTADSVLAWIDGPDQDGTTRRIEYPYHRVPCGAPAKRP